MEVDEEEKIFIQRFFSQTTILFLHQHNLANIHQVTDNEIYEKRTSSDGNYLVQLLNQAQKKLLQLLKRIYLVSLLS